MTNRTNIHVLVYGTLRRGGWNHHLMTNAAYLGVYPLASHRMVDLGAFPAICPDDDRRVICELYRIDFETFRMLDLLEGYPEFYTRKQVEIALDETLDTPTVERVHAWVYYMSADNVVACPTVEGGGWQKALEDRQN